MKKKLYLCHVLEKNSFNKSYFESYSNFFKNSKYKKIYYLLLNNTNKIKNSKKTNIVSFKEILKLSENNQIDFLLSFEFKIQYFFSVMKIKKVSRKIYYILNNTIFYYRNFKFKNKKILFFFKNINTFIKYNILNIFEILKIIPKIDFIFYSTALFINKKKNFFSLQENSPLNIYGYKRAIKINSFAAENTVNIKNKLKKKNIVFIDGGFNHEDRLVYCKRSTYEQEIEYYYLINKLLNKLSLLNKSNAIFLAHPQSNIFKVKKFLKNIKIIQNKTYSEILKSSHVIFHESSSINFAILANKRILSINSPLLGKWTNYRTKQIAKQIKCSSYKLEDICNLSNKNILKILKKPYVKNNSYIKKNLINIYNNKKIINYKFKNQKIFNKYLFNHD